MSDFELLPDLKIIEQYVLYYGVKEKAPIKTHLSYLYQLFKQDKLKYENLKNYKTSTEIIRLSGKINAELNDIFYKIDKRIRSLNLKLWKKEPTIDTILTKEDLYSGCTETSKFITALLNQTDEIEKMLIKEFINKHKYDFYYRSPLYCKLDTLSVIFKKLNEIYKFN